MQLSGSTRLETHFLLERAMSKSATATLKPTCTVSSTTIIQAQHYRGCGSDGICSRRTSTRACSQDSPRLKSIKWLTDRIPISLSDYPIRFLSKRPLSDLSPKLLHGNIHHCSCRVVPAQLPAQLEKRARRLLCSNSLFNQSADGLWNFL